MRRTLRAVATGQAAAGAALLLRPSAVAERMAPHDAPPDWVLRLLGARLAVQAAAEFLRPTPRTAAAGAAVEGAHALTMVPLVFTKYGRAASASAAASGLAALLLWRGRATPRDGALATLSG
jgi:hypothetical protein